MDADRLVIETGKPMQCGEFVNRLWGLPKGGSEGFGDSAASKIAQVAQRGVFVEQLDLNNFEEIVSPGMAFVMNGVGQIGHVGVVTQILEDGHFATNEANIVDGDITTPDVPIDNKRHLRDDNLVGFVPQPGEKIDRDGLCPETTPKHMENFQKGLVLKCDDPIYEKYTDDPVVARLVSAVHMAEKGNGGRCAKGCSSSPVGAKGPMQFMDATWEAYKCEGMDDVENLDHAICAGTNYLTSLLNTQKKNNPDIGLQWQAWKAAYHYNAGYSKPATHAEGIPGGVDYADRVITEMGKLKNVK